MSMTGWFAVWVVCVVISGISSLGVWSKIEDDNEAGLPLDMRPSWKLFKIKRYPWVALREHRRRYPDANRIRFWAVLTLWLQMSVVLSPFIIAALR